MSWISLGDVAEHAVRSLDDPRLGAASGMSMGAQSAGGDVIDSPLQRELALPLVTLVDYATRVVRA